jgi:vacuolar-type H+-ATPase subunit E/Vma4
MEERDTKGKFVKGHSGAKPKGASNKVTNKIRVWIQKIIEDNFQTIIDDIALLDSKERVNAISNLIEYAIPKLSRTELVEDIEKEELDFSKLTDDELRAYINIGRKLKQGDS